MKKFFYWPVIILCLSLFLHCTTFGSFKSPSPEDDVIVSDQKRFIKAIDDAKKYIVLGTYKIHDHILPDADLIKALGDAARRGVNVKVMIEKNLTDPEKKEGDETVKPGDAFAVYQTLGIQLISCPQRFGASHIKVLVADDICAIIGTTNFDKKFDDQKGSMTRDFAIVMRDPEIISELKNVLQADAENRAVQLPDYTIKDMTSQYKLTWGPEQHRQHFLEMIDGATESIKIYQQDVTDSEIIDHLVNALKRSVCVELLMSEYPFGTKHGNKNAAPQQRVRDAGGQVKLTSVPPLHIHAKTMIIDEGIMYVGSSNFFTPSMNKDRQVGLITKDPEHLKPIIKVFEKDWQDTH